MVRKQTIENRLDELEDVSDFAPYKDRADCWRAFLDGDLTLRDYEELGGVVDR